MITEYVAKWLAKIRFSENLYDTTVKFPQKNHIAAFQLLEDTTKRHSVRKRVPRVIRHTLETFDVCAEIFHGIEVRTLALIHEPRFALP